MAIRKIKRSGRKMKKVGKILLALLVFFPLWAKAQVPIDAAEFFSRALADSANFSPALSREKVRFPWIEAYDMRVRTNDFELNQNLYTLRFDPSSIGKRRAQKALSAHLNQEPDFAGQKAFCANLTTVYEDWLMLCLIEEKSRLLQALDTINQDRRRILEKMAGAFDFDFQELLKLRTNESDLEIALHELSLEANRLKRAYGFSPADVVSTRGFIDVEAILDILAVQQPDSLSLAYAETAYEKELINKELDLEIAESREFIDFAQIRYEGPNMDPLRQQLSVGVAFRIPRSGNRRLKVQELKLKQQSLSQEQLRDAAQLKTELTTRRQRLVRDINAYLFYQETIAAERQQLQNLSNQIVEKVGFDPLLLLDIEERHIDTRLKAFRRWEDILTAYLQYMEESGRLCGETERNFLVR